MAVALFGEKQSGEMEGTNVVHGSGGGGVQNVAEMELMELMELIKKFSTT